MKKKITYLEYLQTKHKKDQYSEQITFSTIYNKKIQKPNRKVRKIEQILNSRNTKCQLACKKLVSLLAITL